MKRFVSVLLLAVAIAAPAHARGKKAAPTAPGTYKEWGPDIDQLEVVKTFHFGDYKQVVVEPFDTDSVKLPDKDDNSYDAAKKVVASATEGFVQGLRGSVDPKVTLSEKGGKDAGTLVVRGKVLEMDPGSKAARYWGGFGAGAARTKIEGEIVDGQSGTVLARFTQERRSGIGVMGGDYQELMQRNLNAIGEDVAGILKTF
ncbi:MAG: hypothetical protein JWO56_3667 [Acidobacteria bacterium]|nr:hypothetical protein [Acidobacteriota bacterium]